MAMRANNEDVGVDDQVALLVRVPGLGVDPAKKTGFAPEACDIAKDFQVKLEAVGCRRYVAGRFQLESSSNERKRPSGP